MPIKLNFAAPAAKTFGVVLPLDDRVLDLPGLFDVWIPELSDLTIVDGGVSAWTGRANGRVFGQSNPARRPRLQGGLLRMSSDLEAGIGQLDLMGTPIGTKTAFTIAMHGEIHPSQLGVDNQYFWGTSVAGAMARVAYRFTNNTRYMRYQTNDNALSRDAPLSPDWDGRVGVVVTIDNGTMSMYLTTGPSVTLALTQPFNLTTFSLANAVANASGNLRGFVGKVAMVDRVVSADERALLLQWVA